MKEGILNMETFNILITAVSSVGFPIVVTFVLLWEIKQINENHKAELDSLRKTIEENTLTNQKLCDKLDSYITKRGV